MKINTYLYTSFLIFGLTVSSAGAYMIIEFDNISHIVYEIEEARKISKSALDFNVENFHTQLEIFEYAYQPNNERLDAVERHNKELIKLFSKLETQVLEEYEDDVKTNNALYPNAMTDFMIISSNLKFIQGDWIMVITQIKEYENALSSGMTGSELQKIEDKTKQKVLSNEDLFENLEFNEQIDKFTILQEQVAIKLGEQHQELINKFKNIMYGTSIIITIAGLCIAYFLSKKIIYPIKKIQQATKNIAKGDLNIMIENIQDSSEISELAQDVNMMTENLRKQQEKLLRTEKLYTIGKLAGRLAHDLRNPLSVIYGTMEWIETIIPDEEKKHVERVKESIDRMTHQIKNVLDYVRNRVLKLEKSSLSLILDSVFDDVRMPTNISIEKPKTDIKLVCDSNMLKVVFINLVMNSIQAIGNNQGTIKIHASETEKKVLITIEDTGSGIPSDVLPNLFEPLYTTKQEGTGLGLVSCRSIIEQHNGTISVKTNPTRFIIHLPKTMTVS